jgi:ATP-binding cassette subfamily F protein uup
MLAQRRDAAPVAAAKSGRTRTALPQTSAKKRAARKLSFKEQHALKTLPDEIERLHAQITRHQATLADPALFGRDAQRFRSVNVALEADIAALNAAEERWLALELLREEIER